MSMLNGHVNTFQESCMKKGIKLLEKNN